MLQKAKFNVKDVEIIGRKELYHDFFRAEKITLKHKQFKTDDFGEPFTREILYRGAAVGVLLFDPQQDQIALIEQFRIGAMNEPEGPWCLEIVAGMIEPGETPEDVAHRELIEEAGVTNAELIFIGDYLASPGGSDEKMSLYCGLCDLSEVGGIHGLADEHEDIKVHTFDATEVFTHLYNGRIGNPAALISLQWLQLNHVQLRNPNQ